MNELLSGKLNIILDESEELVTMTWLGDSRDVNPSVILDPYLSEFVEYMKNKPNPNVFVDFTKFHSMNSSTVKPILLFIRILEENSIKATIVYDETVSWQKASFTSLGIVTRSFQFVKVKRNEDYI